MRSFIVFLANLPDVLTTLITLLSGLGLNFYIIIHGFYERGKMKSKTTTRIICISSGLVLGLGIMGMCAKLFLVQVPNVYNTSYYAAVTTLEREGILYECGTALKDNDNDIVIYMSETPGKYITKDTKVIINLKTVDTVGAFVTDNSTGDSHSVLVKDPNYDNYNSSINSSSGLESNIPVVSFLQSDVEAVLNNSVLTIKVDSQNDIFSNVVPNRIFNWGLHLSSSLDNAKEGDVFLELNVSIDDKYSILESVIKVYEIKSNGYHLIKELDNKIDVTYDGKYFNIVCDPNNEYIDLESLCVQTVSYMN